MRTLQARFPHEVIASHGFRGQPTLLVRREGWLEMARFLRDDPAVRCDVLMDLTAVDYLAFGQVQGSEPTLATPSPLPFYMKPKPVAETWQRVPASPDGSTDVRAAAQACRFDVVYHFYSTVRNHRVRVRVPIPAEDPVIVSLTALWASANWFEREVWDMFGIRFTGHPNLKRILLYESFVGHPLRKDYPVNKRQPLIGPLN